MYSYPFANNHIAPLPTFNPIQTNIPEVQYVGGSENVDSFNIPPNKTGVWFNQNKDEFYIVSVDANGNRVKNEFEFKPKSKNKQSEYVLRGEFEALKGKVDKLMGNTQKTPKKAVQREVEDNE